MANRGVVTLGPWQMVNKIVALLRTEVGLVDEDLAVRLNAPIKEVRKAIAIGYNKGRLDRCWTGSESYVVLPVVSATAEASAK